MVPNEPAPSHPRRSHIGPSFEAESDHRRDMDKLIDRLRNLSQRRERFTFDLRGNCLVYSGVVAAYRAREENDHFTDLPKVILHALQHDGILSAWRDPKGQVVYDSCRIFTDVDHAVH